MNHPGRVRRRPRVGLMAIALGLALALDGDRAPATLVKFMGIYWILNGIVTLSSAWRRKRAHAGNWRSPPVRSASPPA